MWRVAQWVGVTLTALLLVGLIASPDLTLRILWNAVIPILPATFLVSPQIWRNVCPLATLTMLPPERATSRRITEGTVRSATIVGLVLLVVLVPARRAVFNTDGPFLATTITAVALLALVAGVAYQRKAGFCNAICPVLPVERLYGQRPMLKVQNVRCLPCIQCTDRGCLDRSHLDSLRTVLGPRRNTADWMFSPFGIFAASFPGFIVGYFLAHDGAPALTTYLQVLQGMVISLVAVVVLVRAFQVSATTGVTLLGAISAGCYYWFVAPGIAAAFGQGAATIWGTRGSALALIAWWLLRARRINTVAPAAERTLPIAG
jgi:nitrite reductase (NADH) large subunit